MVFHATLLSITWSTVFQLARQEAEMEIAVAAEHLQRLVIRSYGRGREVMSPLTRWWKIMKNDDKSWKRMKEDERWWKMMKDVCVPGVLSYAMTAWDFTLPAEVPTESLSLAPVEQSQPRWWRPRSSHHCRCCHCCLERAYMQPSTNASQLITNDI